MASSADRAIDSAMRETVSGYRRLLHARRELDRLTGAPYSEKDQSWMQFVDGLLDEVEQALEGVSVR